MAAFILAIRVILSATNVQVTLSVIPDGGKQQLIRRADRFPASGVITSTMTEWVTGFHSGQFGQPAWLPQLMAGDFRLSIDAPRSADTSGVKAALLAGIAAGKPVVVVAAPEAPVAEAKPEPKPKTRRGRRAASEAMEIEDVP